MSSLAIFPNLGPKSAAMLAGAGITSQEALRSLGAVAAFVRVRAAGYQPSLNLLWALEGGLTGVHWRVVARDHRTSLLLALEGFGSAPAPATGRAGSRGATRAARPSGTR